MSAPAPQTKSEIVRLLDTVHCRPNRRRGQSFLIDGNLMRRVVEAAELTPRDLVFEVGTGTGSLTRLLADRAGEVLTVEVDPKLVEAAEDVLRGLDNVTLVRADVLAGKHHLNPEVIRGLQTRAKTWPQTKLVANLPYGVATPLLVNLMFDDVAFERMVFTAQRELAERLTASPGTRQYGWVSVVTALAGEAKVLRHLPATAFWPEPAVASSLVDFRPRRDWKRGIDVERFTGFGTYVFQQRRKTVLRIVREYLKRAGSSLDAQALLETVGIRSKTRGDQLDPRETLRLSQSIH